MSPVLSFRVHRGALLPCLVVHVAGWTAFGLLFGIVDFLDTWQAVLVGVVAGLTHATAQWVLTSVSIDSGMIVSRNFVWVRQVRIDEIETVHRLRRRGWSGVSIRLVDGEDLVLAAPTSAVLAPNPDFAEDLGRLCAAIALSGDVSPSY